MCRIHKTLISLLHSISVDQSVVNQISVLNQDTTYFIMFYSKFEKLAGELCQSDPPALFRFGWLLFTHNKNHFLVNNVHDYERNLNILLCCFSFFFSIHPKKKKDLPELISKSGFLLSLHIPHHLLILTIQKMIWILWI